MVRNEVYSTRRHNAAANAAELNRKTCQKPYRRLDVPPSPEYQGPPARFSRISL